MVEGAAGEIDVAARARDVSVDREVVRARQGACGQGQNTLHGIGRCKLPAATRATERGVLEVRRSGIDSPAAGGICERRGLARGQRQGAAT